jgi:Ca2+:H+ antiporter
LISETGSEPPSYFISLYKYHKTFIFGVVFSLVTLLFHFYLHSVYTSIVFASLSIALLSITVSEIAEALSQRLDEPYGSGVLTLSAVVVEIIILFMILYVSTDTHHALETVKGGIISAIIVDMNVLLGLAVFIGGLSFKEQEHNEDTSSTYTTILLVASSALLIPSVFKYASTNNHNLLVLSDLIAIVLFFFYIVILIFQTKTHKHFFKPTARSRIFRYKMDKENSETEDEHRDAFERSTPFINFITIFAIIALIGVVAEIFASDGMQMVVKHGFPVGLAGLIIAIISVAPELMTAVKAAKNDQIQRVINIAMGASTVSIMLTVPMLVGLSYTLETPLTLDFNPFQIGALILTVILAWKTTDDGETNYFEGVSHLFFFVCYAIVVSLL